MYVEIDAYTSQMKHVKTTIGTLPALYPVTLSNDEKGTISISCAENHGYSEDGSLETGNYYYNGTKLYLSATVADPANYRFKGWQIGSQLYTDVAQTNYEYTVSGAVSISAVFERIYAITITTPSHGTLTVMDGSTTINNGDKVAEGTTLTVTTNHAADYHFSAWTANGAASVSVNGPKTIGATFAQNDYFLNATYGAGGTSVTRNDGGNSETVKRAGNTVTLTTAAAPGHEFLAWTGDGATYMSGDVFTFPANGSHNTTYNVQATFKVSSYGITYLDKGGEAFSGAHESGYPTTHTYNAATTLKSALKTGYDFGGWFTDENCTGSAITELGATAYTGGITLYAKWTENTYNISLDKNTGDADGTATATYNSTALTGVTAATKAGNWSLDGYFTLANGGDMVITAGGALVADMDGYTDAEGRWTRTDGSMTLYAHWTENITKYEVQFHADEHGKSVSATAGGNSISNGASVQEGTSVTLTAEAKNFYHFLEWQDGNGTQVSTTNPYTTTLTGDLYLTAVFGRDEVIVLTDNHTADEAWYNDYAKLVEDVTAANAKVTVRYERDMKANTWCVFALPFEYSLRSTSSVLKGKVYKLGEVLYTTSEGMTLNFPPVEKNIKANVPYLFYSSSPASNLVFENVALQHIGDGSYEVENSGDIANSSVVFHNTEAMTQLDEGKTEAEKKKTIYLSGNRLYYLSLTNASWMRAFRGYFELKTDNLLYIQPRVRIVLGGETATEIDLIDPDNSGNSGVRKYMENGILVIEREGIRYDATGAKIN